MHTDDTNLIAAIDAYEADCAARDLPYDPAADCCPCDWDEPCPEHDAVAVLPTGSHTPTFEDRCRAARATLYAEQHRRNERFEHLRRLLCEQPSTPQPRIIPDPAPLAQLRAAVTAALPDTRSTRCTCCHEHAHPLFKYDEERWEDEPVHTYLEGGWALRDCPDCIRNHWADDAARYAARLRADGQPVFSKLAAKAAKACQAPLHHWSLEEPDSITVKSAEERALEADYAIAAEAEEPEIADLVERYWAIRFEDESLTRAARREFLEQHEHIRGFVTPDTRPTAQITANLKTGWVTYTSSQAKARVTLNRSTRKVTLRYGRLALPNATHQYDTVADAEAKVLTLSAWCRDWLQQRGIEPNVAISSTERSDAPLDFTRKLRDRLSRQGIACNVRIIR